MSWLGMKEMALVNICMGETHIFTRPHKVNCALIAISMHSGPTNGVVICHGLLVLGMEEEREADRFDARWVCIKFSVECSLSKKTEVEVPKGV